ncbi:hypothetical protein PHSC3_000347 [Chlamydiales bacterium STE3]|nr:hypothetical protein PHSC3_000347 [Chlamydiales bacterium STE3]
MQRRLSLIALPGFLGNPKDWDCFQAKNLGVHEFIPTALPERNSFTEFARQFNSYAAKISSQRVLMGYSMGGRLALHALINQPKIWTKAILISTHPGLTLDPEKEVRLSNDNQWAETFLYEPWESAIKKWSSQAIFKESKGVFNRQENNRPFLASCLKNYSLGCQENLRAALADLEMPILWITGKKDKKFSLIAKQLIFKNSSSKWVVIEDAGHRVPWEQPQSFQKVVYSFLKED